MPTALVQGRERLRIRRRDSSPAISDRQATKETYVCRNFGKSPIRRPDFQETYSAHMQVLPFFKGQDALLRLANSVVFGRSCLVEVMILAEHDIASKTYHCLGHGMQETWHAKFMASCCYGRYQSTRRLSDPSIWCCAANRNCPT